MEITFIISFFLVFLILIIKIQSSKRKELTEYEIQEIKKKWFRMYIEKYGLPMYNTVNSPKGLSCSRHSEMMIKVKEEIEKKEKALNGF